MSEIKKSIEKINAEYELRFDAEKHEYKIKDETLISTTKLIKKYFPFEQKKVARQIAEKKWITEKEVLQEWEQIMNKGKNIHLLIENHLLKEKLTDKEKETIQGAIEFIHKEKCTPLAIEQKIFCKKYKVAGTIDLICEMNGKTYLIDWKTNRKDIDKKQFFEMGEKPFDNLPNNNFFKYSLQLSIYKELLKKQYGIEIYDTLVVHLKDKTYEIIDIFDMSEEAKEILELNMK